MNLVKSDPLSPALAGELRGNTVLPTMPSMLPWPPGTRPLMLAPMQGLTNRALRALFTAWVKPDTLFTEFVRPSAKACGAIRAGDRRETGPPADTAPLVVQLIGRDPAALAAATASVSALGIGHLNLNLGCPFGRMAGGSSGGALLREPDLLRDCLVAMRAATTGSLSVKLRAGFDSPTQVFELLPLFEAIGIDFLVLHPRTVVQKYGGIADHALTAEVVARTRLPVIANGDVTTAAEGLAVLSQTGAAGLMLGRGAIADPWLFERLRGRAPAEPDRTARAKELQRYLHELTDRYAELFCGETQILGKVKEVLAFVREPWLARPVKELRKAKNLSRFRQAVDDLDAVAER